MRNVLIALSSISREDLLLALIPQPEGGHRSLLGHWGRRHCRADPGNKPQRTRLCGTFRGGRGLSVEKNNCGNKNGKRRGYPHMSISVTMEWMSPIWLCVSIEEGLDLWGFFPVCSLYNLFPFSALLYQFLFLPLVNNIFIEIEFTYPTIHLLKSVQFSDF